MKKYKYIKLNWIVACCLFWTAPVSAATAQYTYDSLNRLAQVQYDNGATIVYIYKQPPRQPHRPIEPGEK